MNGRAEVKRRASLILGGIAATAIVLMLLFVWILWRDINRSNRYKRELEEANRSNEALLAAREKLMLTITHDIKAPLSSIMGYIDLLVRLTGEKRQGLYLRNMKASADHLLSLVGNLLDFYRLDANKVEINEVAFNPGELFAQIGAGFAPVAAAKGIGLQTRIDPSAECEVAGDPFRIRQITDNLLSNALKFTDRGSVTIAAELHEGNLIFSVKDTGRGIARAERERIFGEFVRLSSAQGVGGVGLGLSIVDRLVKLLGGRIYLESQPGRGSKFMVRVPVKSAAGVPSERKGEAPAGSGPAASPTGFSGIRCLLVDDDALQLEMAGAMCRQSGCEVECCAYPEYAAKLVAEHRFDVVLTDIQMPGTDGFEVLARIRAVCPELPVVAVSARSDNRADYLGRGFAAVVRKPFSAGELTDAIRVALGRGACGAHDEPQPAENSGQPGGGSSRSRGTHGRLRRRRRGRQLRSGFRCADGVRPGGYGRRRPDHPVVRGADCGQLHGFLRGFGKGGHGRGCGTGAQDAAALHDAPHGGDHCAAQAARTAGGPADSRPANTDREDAGKCG